MARKVKDKVLDTREARGKLKPRGKPYWRTIEQGLHLGYRKLKGKAGTWWARHYIGNQGYEVEALGAADDLSDADGVAIINYWQAQTKCRERMVQRAHAAVGKTGPLTVKDAVLQYVEWAEANRASGNDIRKRAEAFIIPKLGGIECGALTATVLRKWHHELAKQPARIRSSEGKEQRYRPFDHDDPEDVRKRRASANRVLMILKCALNRAWREGDVESDTEWRRVEAFEKVNAAKTRYLTVAEAKRLINACDENFRPLVQAALATGCRHSELCRLRVSDYNSDSRTLAIKQSKTGKPRHVILTDESAALFERLAAGRAGGEPMLRNGGKAWTPSSQAPRMIEACQRGKITPRISFHGLRHTWASLAVMNGVPLMVVARNLGHADTSMVEQHYGHLASSYVADAIRSGAPKFGFSVDKKIRQIGRRA